MQCDLEVDVPGLVQENIYISDVVSFARGGIPAEITPLSHAAGDNAAGFEAIRSLQNYYAQLAATLDITLGVLDTIAAGLLTTARFFSAAEEHCASGF